MEVGKVFLKDDSSKLRQMVETAIQAKFAGREAFTTLDISKPIIEESISLDGEQNRVGHRQIRGIINDMWAKGVMDDGFYTSSATTVFPDTGKPVNVRLFHPDEPAFDVSSYTAVRQSISKTGQAATRGIDMNTDGDSGPTDVDQITLLTTSQSGASVTKQCQIQMVQKSLNVPRNIVAAAGFVTGDHIAVTPDGSEVKIQKSATGRQQVDKEGRIRLHGDNVSQLHKASAADPCTAMVVQSSGETYIVVR